MRDRLGPVDRVEGTPDPLQRPWARFPVHLAQELRRDLEIAATADAFTVAGVELGLGALPVDVHGVREALARAAPALERAAMGQPYSPFESQPRSTDALQSQRPLQLRMGSVLAVDSAGRTHEA